METTSSSSHRPDTAEDVRANDEPRHVLHVEVCPAAAGTGGKKKEGDNVGEERLLFATSIEAFMKAADYMPFLEQIAFVVGTNNESRQHRNPPIHTSHSQPPSQS